MRWHGPCGGCFFATSIVLFLGAAKARLGYRYSTDELHAPETGKEPPARFSELHHLGIADNLPARFTSMHQEIVDKMRARFAEAHQEVGHEGPARFAEIDPEGGYGMPSRFPHIHQEVGEDLRSTLLSPRRASCWMFQHMVKSGGSTVRVMMAAWAAKHRVKHDRYVDFMWLKGDSYANMMLRRNSTYVLGEYTESLRSYGGGRGCKWFTMFRHPISRLVSAFFFCKPGGRGHITHDPLCGHEAIDMETADIVDFAQHWGNYGLRQFVIPYISQDVITSSPAAKECNKIIDTGTTGLSCTAWHLVKLHLQNKKQGPSYSSRFLTNRRPTEEEAMYPYLAVTQARLTNDYAAVGLLEDFETSLRLFNAALGMPKLDWVARYKRSGRKNLAKHGQMSHKEKVLEQAWTNLAVRRYIALDLLLYDHVVAVHKKQVAEHGL